MLQKTIIIISYFFLDQRLLSTIPSDSFSTIYTSISKLVAICYIVVAICLLGKIKNRILIIPFYISLIFISLGISTITMGGDLRRWLMMSYHPLGYACFISVTCNSLLKARTVMDTISNLFVVLASINLIQITFFRNLYGFEVNFLGIDNHMGYTLMAGLMFVLLSDILHYNKLGTKSFYYIAIQTISIIIVWSGTNVVGLAIAIFLLIPNYLGNRILRLSLTKLLLIFFSFVIVFLVMGNLPLILESGPIAYIIQDVIGKNLTLTNRTKIWNLVVSGFLSHPLFGNGIQNTMNLFYIKTQFSSGHFSAHNQFLQSLYEGGILVYISMIPLINRAGKYLKTTKPNISRASKVIIVSILIMFLGEAPGLSPFILSISTCSIVAYVYSTRKSITPNLHYCTNI